MSEDTTVTTTATTTTTTATATNKEDDNIHIDALRAKLKDTNLSPEDSSYCDDATLLRFLRAASYDTSKAFDNLSFCLKWRREFQNGLGVNNITEESCQNELKKELGFYYKTDKAGRPVLYVRPGRYNRADRDFNEFFRYGMLMFETGIKLLVPPNEKITVVMDETGFGMHGLDIEVLKSGAPILDRCYPERIAQIFFINAPVVFSTAWNAISPFINEHTREKIRFFVDKRQLFEFIEESNIPTEFGGSDPFQYDYYLHGLDTRKTKQINKIRETPTTNATVPAGGKYEHKIELQNIDSQVSLCWKFKTEGKDIAFAILKDNNVILPSRRYDSHINHIKNDIKLTEKGSYTLLWDNSFSYWTSKSLTFECFVTDSF